MIFTPRPYQHAMIAHALRYPRSALWAGMGLGKTPTTLTVIDARMVLGEVERTLIIAPKRVALTTWPGEMKKWENFAHLRASVLVGGRGLREKRARMRRPIDIVNYENVPWLVDFWKDKWPYDMVVADESTKLKGFRVGGAGGKRAKKLVKVAFERTQFWLNLTGTPSPNGLQDLWGQTFFLDAGERLGRTFTAFTNRWFHTILLGGGGSLFPKTTPMPSAEREIRERLRDICLSIEAKDQFNLPDLIQNTIHVDLPYAARKAYREMETELFTELAGEPLEAFNMAAKTQKCLQLASGAVYTDHEGAWTEAHKAKIEALDDIIEEAAGTPVLVAYHFRSDMVRLSNHLGAKCRVLGQNPRTVEQWNAGRIPVLLAHPASCGHGLNLQDGGNILVFFTMDWNLENHAQIIERIGPTRQAQSGHDRPVFVHYLVAKDTLDETVFRALQYKRGVQDSLMEAMKERKDAHP